MPGVELLKIYILAGVRRARTFLKTFGKKRFLRCGRDLHVGTRTRLWAPHHLIIGNGVYIGKEAHIECNCTIGDYCLIANRVAFVGKNDHDFKKTGYPVRFAPWVGSRKMISPEREKEVTVGPDVWIGFGTIVLTGVTIGRGAVIAAGAVVTRDIPDYSVAAGNPARVIGSRFSDAQIKEHELKMKGGNYLFSEKGYDHCLIHPGSVPSP